MRDFRRSVIRLLLATCFLLLIAWVGLKLMQYKGDWERLIRDVQSSDAMRFLQDRAVPFFRDKLAPKIEEWAASIKAFFTSLMNK